MRQELSQREFQRILIIKPSSFGDVIHGMPVLHALRERFPQAHIAWLVANSCAGLLEDHPALNEIIRFDRKHYGRLGRNWTATRDFLKFAKGLHDRRFDLVLDLQGLFRSGFFAWCTGAAVRMGFSPGREFSWLFYNHRVRVPDEQMHAVDRNGLFARELGCANTAAKFDLPVKEIARQSVFAKLRALGVAAEQGYALIGPGTRWETKHWPAESFAVIARRLVQERGIPVVLTGMAGEEAVAAKVIQAAGVPLANLVGQTTLAEMIALVAGARVVVMHDSGPMHLAIALNRPLVSIYGPTSPQRTGPYGRANTLARLDVPCSPCYLKEVAKCAHRHRCMTELSPALVWDKVTEALTAC